MRVEERQVLRKKSNGRCVRGGDEEEQTGGVTVATGYSFTVRTKRLRLACFVRWLAFASVVMASAYGATAQENATKNIVGSDGARERTRAVSAHVAAALAEKMPKYEPHSGGEKPKQNAPVQPDAQRPANGIVRLPKYIVEGERLPSTEELRSAKGLEHYTMNKYMGDADGISRGVLNHFTLGGAWNRFIKGRVPLLGRFDWKFSQEDEALKRYYDDEVRKKLRGLVEFDGASARASSAEQKAREQSGDSVAGGKADGTP